jgi:hypothetical protein
MLADTATYDAERARIERRYRPSRRFCATLAPEKQGWRKPAKSRTSHTVRFL